MRAPVLACAGKTCVCISDSSLGATPRSNAALTDSTLKPFGLDILGHCEQKNSCTRSVRQGFTASSLQNR